MKKKKRQQAPKRKKKHEQQDKAGEKEKKKRKKTKSPKKDQKPKRLHAEQGEIIKKKHELKRERLRGRDQGEGTRHQLYRTSIRTKKGERQRQKGIFERRMTRFPERKEREKKEKDELPVPAG